MFKQFFRAKIALWDMYVKLLNFTHMMYVAQISSTSVIDTCARKQFFYIRLDVKMDLVEVLFETGISFTI